MQKSVLFGLARIMRSQIARKNGWKSGQGGAKENREGAKMFSVTTFSAAGLP